MTETLPMCACGERECWLGGVDGLCRVTMCDECARNGHGPWIDGPVCSTKAEAIAAYKQAIEAALRGCDDI